MAKCQYWLIRPLLLMRLSPVEDGALRSSSVTSEAIQFHVTRGATNSRLVAEWSIPFEFGTLDSVVSREFADISWVTRSLKIGLVAKSPGDIFSADPPLVLNINTVHIMQVVIVAASTDLNRTSGSFWKNHFSGTPFNAIEPCWMLSRPH